jgi:hypothetical protein
MVVEHAVTRIAANSAAGVLLAIEVTAHTVRVAARAVEDAEPEARHPGRPAVRSRTPRPGSIRGVREHRGEARRSA